MPKSTNLIEWCTVRIGEDLNWWVTEVSDDVHWDVDGLSIIDPRQISHMIDLVEPLREYSFDQDTMDRAFIPFKISKDLGAKSKVVTVACDTGLKYLSEGLFDD